MNTALSIIEPLAEKKDLALRVVPPKRYAKKLFFIALLGYLLTNLSNPWTIPLALVIAVPLVLELKFSALANSKSYPIKLLFHRLEIPNPIGSASYVQIRYSDIDAFEVRGKGKYQFVTLLSAGKIYNLERQSFLTTLEWNLFIQETFARISEAPGGGDKLADLVKRGFLARSILENRPKVTSLLVVIISAMFLLQGLNVVGRPEELLLVLGNSGSRIIAGEYYRIFTSGFLHLGMLHYGLNILALLSLGYLIEAILGWRAMISVYFSALLFGSLLSAFVGGTMSVGASAAIFGLLGALALLDLRYKGELPAGLRLSRRWWIFVIVVNVLIATLTPSIDKYAHIGGFLAGIILSALVTNSVPLKNARTVVSGKLHRLSILLLLLCAYALITGAIFVINTDKRIGTYIATLTEMVDQESSPQRLNQLAWGIVNRSDSSIAELNIAEIGIDKALRNGFEPAFIDTLATLRARQGRIEEAISLEEDLIQSLPPSILKEFASEQLEKFRKMRDEI